MADADDMLLEALLDDVLDPSIVRDAVDEAMRIIAGGPESDPRANVGRRIAKVE